MNCFSCNALPCRCFCSVPVYDSNGMGCGPCGGSLPCSNHPGSTRCAACGYPRDAHGLGRSHICSSFTLHPAG